MKKLVVQGSPDVAPLVFFAGWGMDAFPFLPLIDKREVWIYWDYTDLSSPIELPSRPAHLLAWSMGVWAATQVLHAKDFLSTTALNGTPSPVHDTLGIPVEIVNHTLDNLSPIALKKFNRRMCGAEALGAFEAHAPHREIDDLKAELASIRDQALARPATEFDWTQAYVCLGDKIFPAANQLNVFPNARQVQGYHWNAPLLKELFEGLV